MKSFTLTIAFFICISSQCQEIKDTLFFLNGTRVIGKIKRVKLGVITFDPDDANDITVQLRRLSSIAGTNKIFRIETIQHRQLYGRISSHPEPNTINVETFFDTIPVKLEDVSVLYPFERTLLQRFSGSVGVGYSYTRSSSLGRLNFDANIKYTSKKEEFILSLSGIYTLYDSLFSRDREGATFKYNYFFAKNWFFTAFLAYQRNLELGLQRRFQEGLGIGNKFLTNRFIYAWGRTGFVFNQEKSTEGISSGVLTELFGQLEFNIFKFEKPKVNLLFAQSFYYSLSQSGRFRNDGSLNFTWEIFKDFKLSFEPYNNFDSKPPVEGSAKFDFGVVFSINYIF